MAFFGRPKRTFNSSRTAPGEAKEYTPVVDKNRHYRTIDIFNRIYNLKLRLEAGESNKTDCKTTIWVKFNDPLSQTVIEDLGTVDGRRRYKLACDHEWNGKNDFAVGKHLPCMKCGENQSYYGMEHELQHNILGTDPEAARMFIDAWAKDLHIQAPHVGLDQLQGFLHIMLNAFDDIRCNSAWEHIYPGSADKIWERWTRITKEMTPEQLNTNFIAFMFAVALGVPTDDDSSYAIAKDTIDWGMRNVRGGKSYTTMLTIARTSLDRCLGALLSKIPPQPPQQGDQDASNGAPQYEPASDDSGESSEGGSAGSSDDDGDRSGGDGEEDSGVPEEAGDQSGNEYSAGGTQQVGPPSSDVPATDEERSDTLSNMMRNAAAIDEDEEHPIPDSVNPATAQKSSMAKVAKALVAELDPNEDLIEMDGEIETVLQQFDDAMLTLSPDSQLLSDAKAKILFLDVKPSGIDKTSKIHLTINEVEAVDRLRSIFYKTLGKQKAMRSTSGLSIDIDAAIQYIINPTGPEIFETEKNNQGFSYLVLVDMSGSMSGTPFGQVCKATEMLKRALHFPFVDGKLWGFRGGEQIGNRPPDAGETWIYRYDRGCDGYLGKSTAILGKGKYDFPVQCGGITPLHSAIRVSVKHLLNQVQSGMAKQLFVLTDGAPCANKTSGRSLPSWILRDFIAKEVRWARQKGISVQSLVIGNELDDSWCKAMFGPTKFWARASLHDDDLSVDKVLQRLVIQNFARYLKTRG